MRTRRSPRNQERLWRALGSPPEPKPKRTRLPTRAEARAKLFPKEETVDPDALWRDLKDELRMLTADPTNQDVRFHCCSLLEALSTWIKRGGFPPKLEE
jgi:hypothetical protein